MKIRAKLFDHAGRFKLLIVFWLSFSLVTPLIRGLGYNVPDFLGRALFTALAVLTCALVHKCPLPAFSFFAFMAAAAALMWRTAPGFLDIINQAAAASRSPDALTWPLAVTAGSTLLIYILVFGLKKPLLPLLVIGLCSFGPLWYLFIDSAYPAALSYATGWLLFMSYKNGAGLWSRAPEKREGGSSRDELRQGWMHYTVSVLGLVLLSALILPKNIAPVNWSTLQNWARERFPFISELRGDKDDVRGGGDEFGFSYPGSRETARLDEPLSGDPTVVLEVHGRGGLYLKGSVFDSYTGKSWTNTCKTADPVQLTAPPAVLSDYLAEIELKIVYRRLRTRTVFSILYPMEFAGLPLPLQVDGNSGLTIQRSLPLGLEYRLRGFIQAYRADLAGLEIKEDLTPDLEKFLELPGNLPPRVRELALEVTAGQQGHYQKMKALESYLRDNYSYNSETPHLTAGIDFVDSFLFRSREGYCTYFATALAVMGRAAGVPTRYVIGFKVPEKRSAGGIYEVAGTDAHAWVEGYIPGIGWLPFEPTPAFSTADSLPPLRDPSRSDLLPPGGNDMPPAPGNGELPEPGFSHDHLSGPPEESLAAAQLFKYIGKVFLTMSLIAAALFSLYIMLRYRNFKRTMEALKQLQPRLQAVAYYNLALSFLERLGAGKYPGETPREYSRRIIRDAYRWDLNFQEISEGINLALYSRRDESFSSLAEQAGRFFRIIFSRYLARVGRWTALFEILLQGKYFPNLPRR